MRISLLLMTLLMAGAVNAQSIFRAGGEAGPLYWYQMDTSSSVHGLRSRIPGNNTVLHFSGKDEPAVYLNFHPALVFSGNNELSLDVSTEDLSSATFFTVYHCTDTARENVIWHMTGPSAANLVLTTSRMADLGAFHYMNYTDIIRGNPKVNTYVQQKDSASMALSTRKWYIGGRPLSPSLPITSFRGLIPEVIVYNRALNGQQRLQVASYLALKYGVTLTEPGATYLNSDGEKIWDGLQYSGYHHNIAGIGRDDSSGLLQTSACSSNLPGLLTISTNLPLSNKRFLLWGDNGLQMTVGKRTGGMPQLLQKKWAIVTYDGHSYKTDVELDTRQVDAALSSNPVYWLAIDRSGKGDFDLQTTEFIRMTSLAPQGKAVFHNVSWNTSGAGKEIFSLIAGQNLLLTTRIDSPACNGSKTGSLEMKILGGNAPYRLTVTGPGGVLTDLSIPDNSTEPAIHDIPAGKYRLRIVDAAQEVYSDSFYINPAGTPQATALMDSYYLQAGDRLTLDASFGLPGGLYYQWTGPGNFQSTQPDITISQGGTYTLQCGNGGCYSLQDITVNVVPSLFADLVVYPNPSPGAFNVRVNLSEPAPVTMMVYTMDGRLVSIQKGEGRSNYYFEGMLQTAGEYQIQLSSGLSKTTKKLIITK